MNKNLEAYVVIQSPSDADGPQIRGPYTDAIAAMHAAIDLRSGQPNYTTGWFIATRPELQSIRDQITKAIGA